MNKNVNKIKNVIYYYSLDYVVNIEVSKGGFDYKNLGENSRIF